MVHMRLVTVFGLALALLATNFFVVINAQAQETIEENGPVLLAMIGTQQVTDTNTVTGTEGTTDTTDVTGTEETTGTDTTDVTGTEAATDTTGVTGTEAATDTMTATEQVTGTDALTTGTTAPAAAPPQAQTLPATGGESPAGLPLALILMLLGMIFCLSGVLITQMKRES